MKQCKGNGTILSAALLGRLFIAAPAAQAGHPLDSDDTATVGKGRVQVEAMA